MIPEIRLWQAVLMQVSLDALRDNDFSYFDEQNRSFMMVCRFANVDYEWLLQAAASPKRKVEFKDLFHKRRIKRGDDDHTVRGESYYDMMQF